MKILKMNDLYVKKVVVNAFSVPISFKLTIYQDEARYFNDNHFSQNTSKMLEEHGFKFYKLEETPIEN